METHTNIVIEELENEIQDLEIDVTRLTKEIDELEETLRRTVQIFEDLPLLEQPIFIHIPSSTLNKGVILK